MFLETFLATILLSSPGELPRALAPATLKPTGTVTDACREIGIRPGFAYREALVWRLAEGGVEIFPWRAANERYTGTRRQNEALRKMIVANRHLFENGALPTVNIPKWRVLLP